MEAQQEEDNLYFKDGVFRSPEMAAMHAIVEQGGFSTPENEARRMIRDGGRSAEIGRAWLADHGLTESEVW